MMGAAIIGMPATAPPAAWPKRRAASVDSSTETATSSSFSASICARGAAAYPARP